MKKSLKSQKDKFWKKQYGTFIILANLCQNVPTTEPIFGQHIDFGYYILLGKLIKTDKTNHKKIIVEGAKPTVNTALISGIL